MLRIFHCNRQTNFRSLIDQALPLIEINECARRNRGPPVLKYPISLFKQSRIMAKLLGHQSMQRKASLINFLMSTHGRKNMYLPQFVVRWVDKRSASTDFSMSMVDALRLSTLHHYATTPLVVLVVVNQAFNPQTDY